MWTVLTTEAFDTWFSALRGLEVIVLLGGGDKATQAKDIASALALAKQL